jgi:hypothetical protein
LERPNPALGAGDVALQMLRIMKKEAPSVFGDFVIDEETATAKTSGFASRGADGKEHIVCCCSQRTRGYNNRPIFLIQV